MFHNRLWANFEWKENVWATYNPKSRKLYSLDRKHISSSVVRLCRFGIQSLKSLPAQNTRIALPDAEIPVWLLTTFIIARFKSKPGLALPTGSVSVLASFFRSPPYNRLSSNFESHLISASFSFSFTKFSENILNRHHVHPFWALMLIIDS